MAEGDLITSGEVIVPTVAFRERNPPKAVRCFLSILIKRFSRNCYRIQVDPETQVPYCKLA